MLDTVRHVAMTKHTLLICSKSCKGVRGWAHPKWHSIGPSTMLNMRCQAFVKRAIVRAIGMIPGGQADWEHGEQAVSAGAWEVVRGGWERTIINLGEPKPVVLGCRLHHQQQ